MSGGNDNKQTTTQTAAPYKAAQPLLNTGMGDALSLYKQGDLVNSQATAVPWSSQTRAGVDALHKIAARNDVGDPNGLYSQMQGIIGRGGYNPDQLTALQGIRDTATGDFDINANPAYAGIRQRAMDAAGDAASSTAAGLGRYASGTHQGVLAREVGNVAGNMDFNEYNNFMNRKSSAQDRLFNAGQTAIGNMPAAFAAAQAPSAARMQIGGMQEDLAGRQLNDQLRNLPLEQIQALLGVASGAGDFGSQTAVAQGPNNSFSNILGAGLGGLGMLSGLRNL